MNGTATSFRRSGTAAAVRQHCRKALYVSPFLDMNMRYGFRVAGPDERIAVGIRVSAPDAQFLNAVLTGNRRDLSDRNLMRVFLTIPPSR